LDVRNRAGARGSGQCHFEGNNSLRARAAIARGEELAETGHYYDAIKEYQRALSIQPAGRSPISGWEKRSFISAITRRRRTLSANRCKPCGAFRKMDRGLGHVYLGMIFDSLGQRERAVNEYSRAKQTNDNTGGRRTPRTDI